MSLGPTPRNTLFDVDEDGHTIHVNRTILKTQENSVKTKKEGDEASVDRFSIIMSMYNVKHHGAAENDTIDQCAQN